MLRNIPNHYSAAMRFILGKRFWETELSRSFNCSVWVMRQAIKTGQSAPTGGYLALTCTDFSILPKVYSCFWITGERFAVRSHRRQLVLIHSSNASDATTRWRTIIGAI